MDGNSCMSNMRTSVSRLSPGWMTILTVFTGSPSYQSHILRQLPNWGKGAMDGLHQVTQQWLILQRKGRFDINARREMRFLDRSAMVGSADDSESELSAGEVVC